MPILWLRTRARSSAAMRPNTGHSRDCDAIPNGAVRSRWPMQELHGPIAVVEAFWGSAPATNRNGEMVLVA